MRSSIRKFWQRLEATVHPEDRPVLNSHPDHTFNLDFPPPAFIGDVDYAPIVILMAHGGYHPDVTPSEFPEPADHREYLQWLKGERTKVPQNLSSYYTQRAFFQWIQDGEAVIVNAVAYRSPKIAQEPQNQKVAKLLPSTKAHHEWLRGELREDALSGKRRVVAHHWRLWKPALSELSGNVHYSSNPISKDLAHDLTVELDAWLRRPRS